MKYKTVINLEYLTVETTAKGIIKFEHLLLMDDYTNLVSYEEKFEEEFLIDEDDLFKLI